MAASAQAGQSSLVAVLAWVGRRRRGHWRLRVGCVACDSCACTCASLRKSVLLRREREPGRGTARRAHQAEHRLG
eukprot:6214815-Pleurochrysis_carterae.AAC.3